MVKNTIITSELFYWTDDENSAKEFDSIKIPHSTELNRLLILILKLLFKYADTSIEFNNYIDDNTCYINIANRFNIKNIPHILRKVKGIFIEPTISMYNQEYSRITIKFKEYEIHIGEIEFSNCHYSYITNIQNKVNKPKEILGLSDEDIEFYLKNELKIKEYWSAKRATVFEG